MDPPHPRFFLYEAEKILLEGWVLIRGHYSRQSLGCHPFCRLGDRGCYSSFSAFIQEGNWNSIAHHAHVTYTVAGDCGDGMWFRRGFVHSAVLKIFSDAARTGSARPGCWKTWSFLMQLWKWVLAEAERTLGSNPFGSEVPPPQVQQRDIPSFAAYGALKRRGKLEK